MHPAVRMVLTGIVIVLAAEVAAQAQTIISFDVPNSTYTAAQSINTVGDVTGWYGDSGGITHGFIRDANGTITPFDAPGSTSAVPASINDAGQVTGQYGRIYN